LNCYIKVDKFSVSLHSNQ